jgi:hypothetical protein
MNIDRNKLSLRVALSVLANIPFAAISHSRAKPCFASSAARKSVSRQGGCPAKKLRVRGLVAAHLFTNKSALWCANSNAARDSESVNDSGTTQYPDRKTEEGHGDKGRKDFIGDSSLNRRGSFHE